MVGRDRGADLVLLLAHGVAADVDPGDEFDPVEIGEAADPPRRLRLRGLVLVRDPRAEFSMPRTRLRPMLAQSGPLGL